MGNSRSKYESLLDKDYKNVHNRNINADVNITEEIEKCKYTQLEPDIIDNLEISIHSPHSKHVYFSVWSRLGVEILTKFIVTTIKKMEKEKGYRFVIKDCKKIPTTLLKKSIPIHVKLDLTDEYDPESKTHKSLPGQIFYTIFEVISFNVYVINSDYEKEIMIEGVYYFTVKLLTEKKCLICKDDRPEIHFIPCNHVLYCSKCYSNYPQLHKTCSKCNKPVVFSRVITMYEFNEIDGNVKNGCLNNPTFNEVDFKTADLIKNRNNFTNYV